MRTCLLRCAFCVLTVALSFIFPVDSYSAGNDDTDGLRKALIRSGSNRKELQKVLDHFKNDELKYKAACFLIENMVNKYCPYNNVIKNYITVVDSFLSANPNLRAGEYRQFYDKQNSKLKNLDDESIFQYDIETITSKYIIDEIESAFEYWNKPWCKDVSFNLFCNYVLPYRIGNEHLSTWRNKFRSMYEEPSKQLIDCQDNRFYKLGIYSEFRKKIPISIYTPPAPKIDIPLDILPSIHVGNCKDVACFCTAQLRALGIPSTIDFVPQWANRSMGHSWSVIFIDENTAIPFGGGEEIGTHFYNAAEKKIAKVFRNIYQINDEQLELSSENIELVPELFRRTDIQDVTSEYVMTSDVVVGLYENAEIGSRKWIFLAVYDNQDWIPIWYGKNVDGNVTFTKLGRGVAYLPFVYDANGDIKGAGDPFLIDDNGDYKSLETDNGHLSKAILTRKYPESKSTKQNKRLIIGGQFFASNDIEFNDSFLIGKITDIGENSFSTLHVNNTKAYKYIKYLCSVVNTSLTAEIQLFDQEGKEVKPIRIHTQREEPRGRQHVMLDGNLLSSCDLSKISGKYIIIEFEHPTKLSYIMVFPRSDANFIERGDHYCLYYWTNDGWIMIDEKDASKMGELEFDNIPDKALLLLCDETKGKEKRIFTLEKGKQIWW